MSPFELLTLSAEIQPIFRTLMREPDLTASQIAQHTNTPLDELLPLLSTLVREARLSRTGQCSDARYRVKLKSKKPARTNHGLLDTLFNA